MDPMGMVIEWEIHLEIVNCPLLCLIPEVYFVLGEQLGKLKL